MTARNLLPLCIATIFLCSTHAGNAQDKHSLVQKLFEVSDVSSQITSGALTATAPIIDRIKEANPNISDDTLSYIQSKIQGELSVLMGPFMDISLSRRNRFMKCSGSEVRLGVA